jgi:hypothetical protein
MKSHRILQLQCGQILESIWLARTCCGRDMDVHESLVSVLITANIVLVTTDV